MIRYGDLLRTLRERFGHEAFRPAQLEVVGRLAAGRSALALFPTGSGKSLCYQLPAMHFPGTTVVVSPLLALMKDQTDACLARGLPVARVDSSLTRAEVAETFERVRRGQIKLLYVSPERAAGDRFAEAFGAQEVSLFAVDEAHTLSQWGANFRPELLRLPEVVRRLGARRVLALTATATPSVVDDICDAFGIAPADRVVTSFYRPNLTLDFRAVSPYDRRDRLAEIDFEGPAIVYATHKRATEELARLLASRGHDARAYHAGLASEERERVQGWFSGARRGVICSTVAFGMGLDKPDVRHVVHFNMPRSIEGYTQEIGRAGRDGRESVCTLLGSLDDLTSLENFAYHVTPTRATLEHLAAALVGGGNRHRLDVRLLAEAADAELPVLETVLWLLEREGVAARSRGARGACRVRFAESPARVAARFDGERRAFLVALFAEMWPDGDRCFVDVVEASRAIGSSEERVEAALEHLAERRLVAVERLGGVDEIAVSPGAPASTALADRLEAFFRDVERRDVARVRDVVRLVEHDGCHTALVLAHFGERLARACGHCTHCRTGERVLLRRYGKRGPFPPRSDFDGFRAERGPALAEPRAAARFLFGFGSLELRAAGLDRHPAFGLFRRDDFSAVVEWLERPAAEPPAPAEFFECFVDGALAEAERSRARGLKAAARRTRPGAAAWPISTSSSAR